MGLPVARNIRVFTLHPEYVTVEWELEPTTLDLAQHTVQVWRSESEGGAYQPVSPGMNAADVYSFRDHTLSMLSKWRHFFYRVRVSGGGDFQDYGSEDPRRVLAGADPGGAVMEAQPDLFALESIRRFDLVLREFGGQRVLAMAGKTWGQRCTVCWDALKRRRTRSDCQTCFGKGIIGGYFRPQETWCMKPPHRMMNQITPLFEMQADDRIMWFSRHPRLKPGDLVANIVGERFRVIAINRSEKGQALTRQTVQLRNLSRDQVEHRYPISEDDWERDTLTTGAVREHIRAMDINSYHEAVGSLGLTGESLFREVGPFATVPENSDASPE
jgi:hypothetical protein